MYLGSPSKDGSAAGLTAQLDGEIDILGVASAPDQRPARTGPLQYQESINPSAESQGPADLFDRILGCTLAGVVNYQDGNRASDRQALQPRNGALTWFITVLVC